MIVLTLEGVPPWDGRYEFSDFAFTNRELHKIKTLSGIRAGELIDALDANDTAAFVGVAMVVLERHGKRVDPDDLWDASVGSITLEIEPDAPVEGADVNPPMPPEPVDVTPSAVDGSGGDSEAGGE